MAGRGEWNRCQSTVAQLGLNGYSQSVQDRFWEFIDSVPYIQRLVSADRPRARNLTRDSTGKIIVDITHPHILEDTDYFRPAALHYKETGHYCDFNPNPNPNSDYGKWLTEEVRRCLEGYVRESDGEWISGDLYFFLNYFPIRQNRRVEEGRRKAEVFVDFPLFWEGHYLNSHYLWQARENGQHACQFASRAKGKTYFMASMLLKRLVIGESAFMTKNINSIVTASQEDYLRTADRVLPMFTKGLEFVRESTQFRHSLLRESMQDMTWEAGYVDLEKGKGGSHNTVTGVSSANAAKLRGSRAVFVGYDEIGSFPSLLDAYNKNLYLVEDGENVFGMQYLCGTAGDKESDFASIKELMYSPDAYNIMSVENVYDREGLGKRRFVYFFPAYMNYANSYDKDGNSDVTKALLSLVAKREHLTLTSTDPSTLASNMAENPIVPQEAILRTVRNIFPVTEINNRIAELDANPHEYDDVWTGTLVMDKNGNVEFRPTGALPIRDFPLRDNDSTGALEIYAQPVKGENGIPFGRYIVSSDPVDDDTVSESVSLASIFVLDLFTDTIVAEFTGRMEAERNYEMLRLLCIYYNAKCLYENNIKGTFAYFSKMNSLDLLADTPEYLTDRQLVKAQSLGANKTKGVRATVRINAFANDLVIKWLMQPITVVREQDGEKVEVTVPNITRVRNRALLREMAMYIPGLNVDRIRSFGILMLYREEKMIQCGGDLLSLPGREKTDYLGDDPYFSNNWRDDDETMMRRGMMWTF